MYYITDTCNAINDLLRWIGCSFWNVCICFTLWHQNYISFRLLCGELRYDNVLLNQTNAYLCFQIMSKYNSWCENKILNLCVLRCEIKFLFSDKGIPSKCRHEIFVQHDLAEVSKKRNTSSTHDDCDFWWVLIRIVYIYRAPDISTQHKIQTLHFV